MNERKGEKQKAGWQKGVLQEKGSQTRGKGIMLALFGLVYFVLIPFFFVSSYD